MSQVDYNLANATGAAFRADINLTLDAIVTWNSGASAPATTFPRMRWVDTGTGTVKRRNAANTGWLVVDTDDESIVLSRSSNTLLDVSDWGKVIIATGTFTQTFDPCANLTDGWKLGYRNDGSGVITLDPNGAELIDGVSTIALNPGDAVWLTCNGSALKTFARTKPRGKQTLWVPVGAMAARVTNGPAIGTSELATNKIMRRTFDFDQSTAEFAQFQIKMPKGWDLGTVTCRFIWTWVTSSGNVVWSLQGVAHSDDDALDAAFGTAQSVTDATLSAVNDALISAESAAITIAGSPAQGDLVTFQVFRDAANGSDTLAADALLLGVEVIVNFNTFDDS